MATVGRAEELETIAAALRRDDAPIVLVEGDAGIGKSTVWRHVVDDARARGVRVLSSAAAESETQLSFTTARDLLDEQFDEVADDLPAPQRRALEVVLLRESPEGGPAAPEAVAVALTAALRALVDRGPTLLAVDDIQWLDAATERPLGYALRRLEPRGFAVVLTRRVDPERPRPLGLDRISDERLHVVPLGALSVGAISRVIHDALGTALPRPTLHRLHELSGGNPFYALELARALDASGPLAPGSPLPVPGTLHALVRTRLAALPPATLDTLAVAAALSRATLHGLAAALEEDPLPLLAPAVDGAVVALRDNVVLFGHPLFAAAVYDLAGVARRREIHRRLSDVALDVEERARHLALAAEGPDENVAAALDDAAARIRTRGARFVSAELYEAAARSTPPEDFHVRARRLLRAAQAFFESGDTDRARLLFERLVGDLPSGPERVEALSWLGLLLADTGGYADGMQLWRDALRDADDDAIVSDIHRNMAIMTVYGGPTADAVDYAERALAAAEASGDTERITYAVGTCAIVAVLVDDPSYTRHVERALRLEAEVDLPPSMWLPTLLAGECAHFAYELNAARTHYAAALERALAAGDAEIEWWAAIGLARVAYLLGDLASARELAQTAFDLADALGRWRLPSQTLLAELAAYEGRREEAYAVLRAVVVDARRMAEPRWEWHARAALGRVAFAAGDGATAADELLEARRLAERYGMRHPSLLRAAADEVEAAVACGRLDQAEAALAAARARATGGPWREPILLRATGVLDAAHGDMTAAEAALERARRLSDSLPPLQRARVALALGSIRRRARHRAAAREALEHALSAFEACCAVEWAARARDELARVGGRAASDGGLTPAEQRIAALVGEGRTNKEVAAALVVTERTVESALTQIYRKVGVRSRTELARRLHAGN